MEQILPTAEFFLEKITNSSFYCISGLLIPDQYTVKFNKYVFDLNNRAFLDFTRQLANVIVVRCLKR